MIRVINTTPNPTDNETDPDPTLKDLMLYIANPIFDQDPSFFL